MGREELVAAVASVLSEHDCGEYAARCICGRYLYHRDGEACVSMRRHRAENIIAELEQLAVLKMGVDA